jgi:UDP-N-acetylmuramyl pentapeptide phosphotransferase/UDP-N-acetylglucosamine-1-phosphate transferase
MFEIYVIFFTLITTILINYILSKTRILIDKKYLSHKSFLTKNETTLSGGIIFFLSVYFFLPQQFDILKVIFSLMLLVGILSDLNFISSPVKRIIFQVIIILIFLYFSQTFISSIKLSLFDSYLENIYFRYVFTLLCFLVLINGSNFMDGVNTLAIGYYLIITGAIIYVVIKYDLNFDQHYLKVIFLTLSIIFIFNFFGTLFLGDSGAYLISFIIGYFLIDFANTIFASLGNKKVSPYFVACLLWYPVYENLFSIIRKKIKSISPTKPDNKHFHQLLFIFIKKKFNYSEGISNTLTGLIINAFNLLIFINATNNITQTKNLLLLISISLLFYNSIYFYLLKINRIN